MTLQSLSASRRAWLTTTPLTRPARWVRLGRRGPNAPTISLTKMGPRVVTPTEVDDDKKALREAA